LEFLIPAENDTYIDLNIRLFIRGKLTVTDGMNLDETDHTRVTNNFLHYFFTQCSLTLNGTTITQTTELYPYRSYLETLLIYGSDAAAAHLTKAFWYVDYGEILPCDPTKAVSKEKVFKDQWIRIVQSKEVQVFGRINNDIFNVILYLLPGLNYRQN